MLDEFTSKLVLSFIVGGVWVSFAIMAAEKFGSKIGGVVGSLPSTVLVSLLFIGWTNTPEFAASSTVVIPATMGACVLFLLVYIKLIKHGVIAATAGATLVWFAFSTVIAIYLSKLWLSFIALFVILAASFYALKRMGISSGNSRHVSYDVKKLAFRAVFAGGVVALSVVLAKLGGPGWGGAFSAYPAVFTSTMVLLTIEHGPEFPASVAKTFILTAPFTISVYAVAVMLSYPVYGLLIGTVLSYVASAVTGVIVFQFVKKTR